MKREILSVISCRDLNAGVYELVLSGASDMRAGQFVELSVPGFYLRRPISVADCADGVLTLLFEANAALGSLRASSQQYAQNPKLQQIAAILERYPGVMLGAELKRR